MLKIKNVLAVLLVFTQFHAAFGAVQFSAGSSGTVKDVPISDSIKVDINGKSMDLKRVTYGLRQKKVALFWANVYVAQIFSNAKADLSSVDALRESLIKGMPVVVTMTFLRDVDSKKISAAYNESFGENGVKSEVTPYSDFLSTIKTTGDVKDGQTYFVVFSGDEKKTNISFITQGKENYVLNNVDLVIASNFMKLWLGKPVDSGLEQLQNQFLKPTLKPATGTPKQTPVATPGGV